MTRQYWAISDSNTTGVVRNDEEEEDGDEGHEEEQEEEMEKVILEEDLMNSELSMMFHGHKAFKGTLNAKPRELKAQCGRFGGDQSVEWRACMAIAVCGQPQNHVAQWGMKNEEESHKQASSSAGGVVTVVQK